MGAPVAGFVAEARGLRHELVPLAWCQAQPSGMVTRDAFERVSAMLIEGLRDAGALDAVYLDLHGAMVAEHVDDADGELLRRVRTLVGPTFPIVASLDFHANVSPRMAQEASALVSYRTYPHIDMFEVGQKAARLMLRILRGKVRPRMAYRKLPLIIQAENSQTTRGPMHKLIRAAQALEQTGKAEAVSIFPVQPWMDIAEMGCAVVAVTNGDLRAAQRQADTIARRLWTNKTAFEATLTPVPVSEGPFALLAEKPDPLWSLVGLLVFAAVLLALSVRRVRRMEVLYGED